MLMFIKWLFKSVVLIVLNLVVLATSIVILILAVVLFSFLMLDRDTKKIIELVKRI